MLPRLMVLSDTTRVDASTLLARVRRLCALAQPGSVLVELRDRQLPARERLHLGLNLAEAARTAGQAFAVNDRLDLAALLHADLLHLPEDGVDSGAARQLLGAAVGIARPCHDPSQVLELDADLILLSPILAERKGRPAWGIVGLRLAKKLLTAGGAPARLFALGGVDETNAAECLAGGADGVAVIGAALETEDASGLLRALGIFKAN